MSAEGRGRTKPEPASPSHREARGAQGDPQRRPPVPPELAPTGKFPRAARVRRRWEFNRIHRQGARVQTPAFTVIAIPSITRARPRLGVAINRKVGSAVRRNRVRRLIRETFRRGVALIPPADLVVVVRPEAVALALRGLDVLAGELLPALVRAGEQAVRGPRSSRGRGRGPAR